MDRPPRLPANRADICRLRQLEADLVERDERIAALERRALDLMEQQDGLNVRQRTIEAEQALSRVAAARPLEADDTAIKALTAQLQRERAHADGLEERVAVPMHAAGKLSADLHAEAERRRVVESELGAVEAILAAANEPTGVDTSSSFADLDAPPSGPNSTLRRRASAPGGTAAPIR